MSDDEFNESCAKAMGWEYRENEHVPEMSNVTIPKECLKSLSPWVDEFTHLGALLFESDYNWAYVMMQKCFDKGIVTEAHNRINKNGMMDRAFSDEKDAPKQPEIPSAKQISLACLEVLNEHK